MARAYTIPGMPLNLSAENIAGTKDFNITWENPFDPSGIKGAWYKLSEAPLSNDDGIYTEEKTFKIKSEKNNQKLYLWLDNNDGYTDYNNAGNIILKRFEKKSPPSSGGGGSSTGGGISFSGGGSYSPPKKIISVKKKESINKIVKTKVEAKSDFSLDKPAIQMLEFLNEGKVIFESGTNLDKIISHNNVKKDVKAQGWGMHEYTMEMVEEYRGLTVNNIYAINNFIVYGTITTRGLGVGERARVIDSYKKAFGKLPLFEERNSDIESDVKEYFKKVYLREPDMDNIYDHCAISIMAYGIRPRNRNLSSERFAINVFGRIYGRNPQDIRDWDIIRAIAYSGSRR